VGRLWLLLAEGESYRSRGGASQYLFLLAAVGGVVLAIVGIYFWNTTRKQRVIREQPDATPEDLLAELFRVHELSRAEQSLVTLLAKSERLAQPALVFVEPGPLDRAIEAADPDAPRYQALRQKLFGYLN
jgi:hypothetical protein